MFSTVHLETALAMCWWPGMLSVVCLSKFSPELSEQVSYMCMYTNERTLLGTVLFQAISYYIEICAATPILVDILLNYRNIMDLYTKGIMSSLTSVHKTCTECSYSHVVFPEIIVPLESIRKTKHPCSQLYLLYHLYYYYVLCNSDGSVSIACSSSFDILYTQYL
jgi:hypothetical protein